MAYKSLFQPITEQELEIYNRNHSIVFEDKVDPRAIVNEDQVQNNGVQQPVNNQTQQTQQTPQVQQTQQTPQVQQTQQQNPAQQGGDNQSAMFLQKVANRFGRFVTDDQTWKNFVNQQTLDNCEKFLNKFIGFAQEYIKEIEDMKNGNNTAQQNPSQPQAQPQAQPVQTQQPQAQPQAQPVQTQQPQAQPSAPVTGQFESEELWKHYYSQKRLFENNDSSEDDDVQKPKKSEGSTEKKGNDSKGTSKSKSGESKKSGSENDTKDVTYDGAYKKDEGGKVTDFGWDEKMKQSIFGTGEDPFAQDNDVTYSSEYTTSIKQSDRDKVEWDITPTKPEPFNPEKPTLTSLSNPSAVGKTVFTTGKVEIKDAPTVGSNTGSVSGGTAKETPKKKDTDDGSDDVSESFNTNLDDVLNESSLSDTLKKVIMQEFMNEFGGEFDLSSFHEWLSDNYPRVVSDPNAFDEIASEIEKECDAYNANESDDDVDMDDDDDADELENVDGEDVSIEDAVDEYIEQYDGMYYDEEDASEWFEDNFDDEDSKEDFLDMVSDQFIEDDINESFDDEFFANEKSLNE